MDPERRKLLNIILMGVAFMMIFTAFQTSSMIEQTVINSVKKEAESKGEEFTGSGYYSLSILYAVFALSNWIAPAIVNVLGPRASMFLGSCTYLLFIVSFLKPMTWALYTGSAVIGFGAAILWTAQGKYLSINSSDDTIGRNSGIFWALLQCSLLFGNLYVSFAFEGETDVSDATRTQLYTIFSSVCAAGCLMLWTLGRTEDPAATTEMSKTAKSIESIKQAVHLISTKDMIFLLICIAYTGFELTFFQGVYGTCIGNNGHFGTDQKRLIGFSGMLIGIGEIVGGSVFGLLSSVTKRLGRNPVVFFGFVVHFVSFFLVFINMPDLSPIRQTIGPTYIPSYEWLALVCSFLLGLADSSFNTQLYSIVGFKYRDQSAAAFGLFKFMQSLTAAGGFFYSNILVLKWQLAILVVTGFMGTLSFFQVEWALVKSQNQYERIN